MSRSLHGYTDEQWHAYLHRAQVVAPARVPRDPSSLASLPPAPHAQARDRYRSKTERLYAQRLAVYQYDGLIKRWEYEPLKLRLAATCFYTPDFLVIFTARPDVIELHEVKGFWRDDARVKFKVAATQFPYFRFRAVKYVRGDWLYEEFSYAAH